MSNSPLAISKYDSREPMIRDSDGLYDTNARMGSPILGQLPALGILVAL